MRFSSKGRYAMNALIHMAQKYHTDEQITILSIAQTLGISKIYLEQVYSMLKRANIVTSIKGAQGGYKLAVPPEKITVGDIARAVETNMFEKPDASGSFQSGPADRAMEQLVWSRLDGAIGSILDSVTLLELSEKAAGIESGNNLMFYI